MPDQSIPQAGSATTAARGAAAGATGAPASAVAWPAILGGAFAAAALTLILVILGSGLGFASTSPWSGSGISATTFTVSAAVWLIVTQWLASGVGGYITGRLRTDWVGVHTNEMLFRDTANGLLTWCVATVIGAGLLAAAGSFIVGKTTAAAAEGASQAAAQAGGAAAAPMASSSTSYFVDSLYRTDHPNANASSDDVSAQTSRILLNGLRNGDVAAPDRTYLAQLVAARTGLSQDDATKRVDQVIGQAKAAEVKAQQAADAARKAAAKLSIGTALSMVIGAFIACVAAALGGRRRALPAK
jgi:hypothetical protein